MTPIDTIKTWLGLGIRSVTISHRADGYSVELYDNERGQEQDGGTFDEAVEAAAATIEDGLIAGPGVIQGQKEGP